MTVKADRRALILARLGVLLSGVTIELSTGMIPVGNYVHNRNELPAELVPGIILLDADEIRDLRFPVNTAGRALHSGPGMMKMTPEIYIVLDVRKPKNALVGEDLNTARAALINLVLEDATLQTIVGNGTVVYDGCVTDLARNRTMQGQMGLSFTMSYPFIPGELSTT